MPSDSKPVVAILMGSHSDHPTMEETEKLLERFQVPYVTRVTSAHRAARRTHELTAELERGGVRIFVVGAGLAAHLAGAVAGVTTRPVIGVPMAGGSLQGVDALYSTVKMPSGIPVATMAIMLSHTQKKNSLNTCTHNSRRFGGSRTWAAAGRRAI